MTDTDPPAARRAPDEVWAQVRDAYLSGMSAPACCRRFGVSLSALRGRAARDGWRRADVAWMPMSSLDPEDEGVKLEEDIDGDLDMLEPFMLANVARARMMRAVLRGDAAEAVRWRRIREAMEVDQLEFDREAARDDAHRARFPTGMDDLNDMDDLHGASASLRDPGPADDLP